MTPLASRRCSVGLACSGSGLARAVGGDAACGARKLFQRTGLRAAVEDQERSGKVVSGDVGPLPVLRDRDVDPVAAVLEQASHLGARSRTRVARPVSGQAARLPRQLRESAGLRVALEDRKARAEPGTAVRIAPHVDVAAVRADDRALRLCHAAGFPAGARAVLARAVVREAPCLARELGQSAERLLRSAVRRARQQGDTGHRKSRCRGPAQNTSTNDHEVSSRTLRGTRPATALGARVAEPQDAIFPRLGDGVRSLRERESRASARRRDVHRHGRVHGAASG